MRTVLSVAVLLVIGACGSQEKGRARMESKAGKPFAQVIEDGYRTHFDFRPAAAVGLGYHDRDGKLPDHSKQAVAAEIERLSQLKTELLRFRRTDLSAADWLDREVFLAEVRKQLFDLDVERGPFRDPQFYLNAVNIDDYVLREYAPAPQRIRAIANLCSALPAYFETAWKNLESPFPRPWLDVSLIRTRGLVTFLQKDVPAAFGKLEAAEQQDLHAARTQCATSLDAFAKRLEAEQDKATDAFALGSERFLRMLADKEGIDIDLERLAQIGAEDMERNTTRMREVARAINKKKSMEEVVQIVKADKPTVKGQIDLAEKQAVQLRKFLLEKAVISIPTEDVAEVRESPPFMRYNSAFLNAPGAFEPAPLKSFYYISPPDPSWTPKEQKDYIMSKGELMATTIHELWPGHFLHALHTKVNRSRIVKSFCTYSMVEGWAHYTEEMMWDLGAAGTDPKMKVGQLSDALLRNARYLAAVGMHTASMSVADAEQIFLTQGLTDPGTARQQATRGTFDPGYLNYTLGKLLILELREAWRKKVGAAYSDKAFHDKFLSYGCAPIPVIKTLMLDEPS